MNKPIRIRVDFNEHGWTPAPNTGSQYRASDADDESRRVWEIGDTPAEAIGCLIANQPERFGVELSGLEVPAAPQTIAQYRAALQEIANHKPDRNWSEMGKQCIIDGMQETARKALTGG